MTVLRGSWIETISRKEPTARRRESGSFADSAFDAAEDGDDTDALPFLSLAVDRLIDRDEDESLVPVSPDNASNDALDSDTTAPLPILDAAALDTTAPRPALDAPDEDDTAPVPLLDQHDADTTASLPAPDAGKAVQSSGLWETIRTYIGF